MESKSLKYRKRLDETATPQQVMDAIKKRYEVKITYAGDENGKGKGVRLIQPVAYGKSKAGNPVIRAFQPFGDTTTKVPHWKLFRLDRIDKWSGLRNRKFDTPPAQQWGGNAQGVFNPNGDKSMAEVYMVADFEGTKRRYNDNLRKHNEKLRAEKQAKDPFYRLKQNIKNSIKGDPEIMKRVAEWQKEQERQKQGIPTNQLTNAREMASIKDFGDTNTVSTSGPVSKQDTVIKNTTPQQQNNTQQRPEAERYRNVLKNGPVYKGETQNITNKQQETPNEIEDQEQELENNLENDNEKRQ